MLVLFFFVCSLIGLLISAALEAVAAKIITTAIVTAITTMATLIANIPLVGSSLLTSGLPDLKQLTGRQLPDAVIWASENALVRRAVAANLKGISFLRVDENGRLKDLFGEGLSPYDGLGLQDLEQESRADSGRNIPVLLIDMNKTNPSLSIKSPGPILIYGQGKVHLHVVSKTAILLANEELAAPGSVIDAPIVVASQLDEGNGLQIQNSSSPNHRVRVIPFSDLRSIAQTTIDKILTGQALDSHFSFEGMGREMESMDVPPPPSAKELWKSVKCEPGFFYLRCHIRFDREALQGFVNKFATPEATRWDIDLWGANLKLGIQQPRVFIENGKIRLLLDVQLANLSAPPAGAREVDKPRLTLVRFLSTAYQRAVGSIPDLEIKNVEVVVDRIEYQRHTGKLYIKSAHINDFDLSLPGKDTVLNLLNEVIPRYLANKPIYDLSDLRIFKVFSVAKRLERVEVDPADQLHLQAHIGFGGRQKDCATNLLD